MEPLLHVVGKAVPLDRANVDTDAIIPKQFLKRVPRSGYGPFLFYDWRYTEETICRIDEEKCDYVLDRKILEADFPLNNEVFAGANILLARNNFGCGSSREHAVWALMQHGFRAVIAPSGAQTPAFADIFRNNAYKNGLLAIELAEEEVATLFDLVQEQPDLELAIDIKQQTVTADTVTYTFALDSSIKENLLLGLDDIGKTLQYEDKIREYEEKAG